MTERKLFYKLYTNGEVGRRQFIRCTYKSKEDVEGAIQRHPAFRELGACDLALIDSDEDEEAWESVKSLPEREVTVAITSRPGRVEHLGSNLEGIRNRPWHIKREQLCIAFLARAEAMGYGVLRGAPQTGKTALLQLLGAHIHSTRENCTVHYLPAHLIDLQVQDFQQGFAQHVQSATSLGPAPSPTWRELKDSLRDKNHTHYLLVDECQRLYDARAHADDFFNTLKFMSSSSCPGVVIVVSIMYGSQPSGVEIEAEEGQIVERGDGRISPPPAASPFAWDSTVIVDMFPSQTTSGLSLAFSNVELTELLAKLSIYPYMEGILSDDDTRTKFSELTSLLPGPMVIVLDIVLEKKKDLPGRPADSVMRYVMNTDAKFAAIARQRSFIQSTAFTAEKRKVLLQVLQSDGAKAKVSNFSAEDMVTVVKLLRSGLFQTEDNCIAFVSGLHRTWYLDCLTGPERNLTSFHWRNDQLRDFAILCISNFSAQELLQTLTRAKDNTILEPGFQYFFLRAAKHACGPDNQVHPEVGNVYGSSGFLDFIVQLQSGTYWNLELLVNGSKAKSHAERFQPGNIYDSIPRSDHLLLDFRQTNSALSQRKLEPHFVYIYFQDDYKQAIVRSVGKEDQCILLQP